MSKKLSPETPVLGDLVRIPSRLPGQADTIGRVLRVDLVRGYKNPREVTRWYHVDTTGMMHADVVKVEA